MKGRHIILGQLLGREAAALLVDGQLTDLIADPGELASLRPGAICRGVTERLMKGQGGVFVRLPDGQRGYLRDRNGVSEGQPMLVQVSGVADEGKAIPLSHRLLFRGRHVLVTPGAPGINVSRRIRDPQTREALEAMGAAALGTRDYGLIMRSAAEHADPEDIVAELTPLVELADQICSETQGAPELLLDAAESWEQAWTEWADPAPDQIDEGEDSFEIHGILDQLDALSHPRLDLPGGGHAYIEQTRALIAVDVNTGSDTSPAAALKANLAVARDLPRQLRLRGMGGQVIVDFAPMPKRDRAPLEQTLRACFRNEGSETTLIGWTAMGLFELSRKRDRVPLARLLAQLPAEAR